MFQQWKILYFSHLDFIIVVFSGTDVSIRGSSRTPVKSVRKNSALCPTFDNTWSRGKWSHLRLRLHWASESMLIKLLRFLNNYRPQRSWGKVIFSQASVILLTGGCVWRGGHVWQGGHAWQGACVAGGHVWVGVCMAGGCMVGGACMAGVHAWGVGCMHGEGAGMHGKRGACMMKGGMHGKEACVVKGVWYACPPSHPSTRYGRSMRGRYASYLNAFLLNLICYKMIWCKRWC